MANEILDTQRGILWFDGLRSVDLVDVSRVDIDDTGLFQGGWLVMVTGYCHRVSLHVAQVADAALSSRKEA